MTPRGRVVIQKALSADHDVTVAETNRRGHATRLALGAAATGFDVVVALGGDGTLNETANGLVGTDTALGVLPGGSTNVFARTIGMTNDPIEATGELLQALGRDSIRRIGVGSVNGRYFLFHVGMGFDAAVVEQVEKRGGLKRYAGHPLFVYAGFSTWFRHYDRSRARFTVTLPDGTSTESSFAICLNTNPYTYLGNRPLEVAPKAGLEHGLSIVTIRSMRFVPLANVILSALGVGKPVHRHRVIAAADDLAELRVSGHGPFPYQVDGDHLGDVEELRFRHHPEQLRLVVP